MSDTKDFRVYIIRCQDDSLYTGIAKDVWKRFQQHLEGKGAKYFRKTEPVSLVWASEEMTRSQALKIEYKIKQLSRKKKINFIWGAKNVLK